MVCCPPRAHRHTRLQHSHSISKVWGLSFYPFLRKKSGLRACVFGACPSSTLGEFEVKTAEQAVHATVDRNHLPQRQLAKLYKTHSIQAACKQQFLFYCTQLPTAQSEQPLPFEHMPQEPTSQAHEISHIKDCRPASRPRWNCSDWNQTF